MTAVTAKLIMIPARPEETSRLLLTTRKISSEI